VHIGRLANLAILTTHCSLSIWVDAHVLYDSSGSLVKPDIEFSSGRLSDDLPHSLTSNRCR